MAAQSAKRQPLVSPDLLPAGWSREQLIKLSETMLDRVTRYARFCNDSGLRLRLAMVKHGGNEVACEILGEGGRREPIHSANPPAARFASAREFGLNVRFAPSGDLVVLSAADSPVPAGAAVEDAVTTAARGRRRGAGDE